MFWGGFLFALGALLAVAFVIAFVYLIAAAWDRYRAKPKVIFKWGVREWVFFSLIALVVLSMFWPLFSR